MATRVFSDEELAQLRGFPEITRELSPGQLGARVGGDGWCGAGAFRAARRHPRRPIGVGLLKVAAGSWPASPPALWLVATVLGTLLAAALTTITAGISARRPAAETLQAETA